MDASIESIDELFARTLEGEYDSEEAWSAVKALQQVGNRLVFDRAAEWCKAEDPLKRARGADILGQLSDESLIEECEVLLRSLAARETDSEPLSSALFSLGHLGLPESAETVIGFHSHPDADVRMAVASSLGQYADDSEQAVAALLKLMTDEESDVRDWAAFNLGVISSADSPEIRDALADRLRDESEDVREEAMTGLAKRQDRRALEPVLQSLSAEEPGYRAFEAADHLLGWTPAEEERQSRDEYLVAIRKLT